MDGPCQVATGKLKVHADDDCDLGCSSNKCFFQTASRPQARCFKRENSSPFYPLAPRRELGGKAGSANCQVKKTANTAFAGCPAEQFDLKTRRLSPLGIVKKAVSSKGLQWLNAGRKRLQFTLPLQMLCRRFLYSALISTTESRLFWVSKDDFSNTGVPIPSIRIRMDKFVFNIAVIFRKSCQFSHLLYACIPFRMHPKSKP